MSESDKPYVQRVRFEQVSEPDEEAALNSLPGLQRMGPVTFTGYFVSVGDEICGVCLKPFHPGPEGVPIISSDEFLAPVCVECFSELERAGRIAP